MRGPGLGKKERRKPRAPSPKGPCHPILTLLAINSMPGASEEGHGDETESQGLPGPLASLSFRGCLSSMGHVHFEGIWVAGLTARQTWAEASAIWLLAPSPPSHCCAARHSCEQ